VVTVPEPAERKRKKRRDLAQYQNPSRAVQMAKKYPDQMLKERDGRLWCDACRKFVNFKEGVFVKQHLFGARKKGEDTAAVFAAKPEEEKKKLKHYRNVADAKTAAEDKGQSEDHWIDASFPPEDV
jgi:hypothetical protein